MRFLQASDFHLHPEHPERLAALEAVVRRASEESADALLIPGDLFDDPAAAMMLRSRVREILERFPGPVLLIPGNHDRRPGGATAFPTGADYGCRTVLLDEDPYAEHVLGDAPGGEVRVVGVPFRHGGTLGRDLAGFSGDPLRTVLLAHGTLQDDWLAGIEDEERAYYPIRRADLEGRFAYAALGHLHAGATIPRGTPDRAWGYAGSPIAITRGESGPRHAVRVDLDPGRGVRDVEAIRLATPYWEAVRDDVSPWETAEDLLARLRAALETRSEPADPCRGLRVHVGGFVDADEAGLKAAIERALDQIRPRHRVVELGFEVATVSDLLERNPWLDDLLRRLRRLADRHGADAEVLRRATGFLTAAVEESGA